MVYQNGKRNMETVTLRFANCLAVLRTGILRFRTNGFWRDERFGLYPQVREPLRFWRI